MSLLDLGQLLVRRWRAIFLASIGCAAAAILIFGFLFPARYEASSTITVSDPSGNVSTANMLAVVNSFVQTDISSYAIEEPRVKALVEPGSSAAPQTLTIVIEGPDREECVNLANSIAESATNEATEVFASLQESNEASLASLEVLNTSEDVASVLSGSLLQNILGSGRTFEFCTFMVNDAIEAERTGPGVLTLGVIGLLGGFILATTILIVADMANPRIKNASELEEFFEKPVLCDGADSDYGDQLWANVCFSLHGEPDSVCLVSLKENEAIICVEVLETAIRKTGNIAAIETIHGDDVFCPSRNCDDIVLYCCAPLSDGVGALYCSHVAGATIIPVRKWSDSRKDLEETLKKLSLANANVVGFALLPARK